MAGRLLHHVQGHDHGLRPAHRSHHLDDGEITDWILPTLDLRCGS
jgi:hypothetical protein